MNSSGNRFKIVNVKNLGIEKTVPADDVEWMVIENEFVQLVSGSHADFKIPFLQLRRQFFGETDIPLAERRVFEKLPIFIAIPLGNFDAAL